MPKTPPSPPPDDPVERRRKDPSVELSASQRSQHPELEEDSPIATAAEVDEYLDALEVVVLTRIGGYGGPIKIDSDLDPETINYILDSAKMLLIVGSCPDEEDDYDDEE